MFKSVVEQLTDVSEWPQVSWHHVILNVEHLGTTAGYKVHCPNIERQTCDFLHWAVLYFNKPPSSVLRQWLLSRSTQSVCYLSACDLNSASENLSSWQMKRDYAQSVQAGQTGSRAKLLRRHRPTAKTISSLLPLIFFWSGYVLIIILSLFWLSVILSHTLSLVSSLWNDTRLSDILWHMDCFWKNGPLGTEKLKHPPSLL